MKCRVILILMLFGAFQAFAQSNRSGLFGTDPIDSTFFKNRGVYVSTSTAFGFTYATENKFGYSLFGSRVGVNWMTKRYRKFQCLASTGMGISLNARSFFYYDLGFLVGKVIKGKGGFYDLNLGLSATGIVRNDQFEFFWQDTYLEDVESRNTVGIPFDASLNTARFPVGIGVGIAGNLNISHPYICGMLRFRFGNPVLKVHSSRK
jgi:hypothetical protein